MPAILLTAFWLLLGSAWGGEPPGRQKDMIYAESPHYELIAPCQKDFCLEILSYFESSRLLLEKNLQLKTPARKILLYVAPSERHWPAGKELARAAGFYASFPSRDAIVLKSFDRWAEFGLHELTHLWVRYAFGALPLWLNEGLAVYFQGTMPFRDGLLSGMAHQEWTQLLQRDNWLPARVVFSVSDVSELRKLRQVHLFYGQSWAMVHLLRLSPRYEAGFDEFLRLVHADVPVELALARAFGLTPEQLMREAQKWVGRSEGSVEKLQRPPEWTFQAKMSPAPPDVLEFVSATLLEFRRPRGQKEQRYEELRRKYPQDCRNAMLFGDLAYAYGLVPAFLDHYKEALRCGASRALLAEGIRAAAVEDMELTQTDRQSLAESAGLQSLVLDIASALLRHRQFSTVLGMTEDLGGFRQDDHSRAIRLRALALSQLGRNEEAEQEVRRLIAMARNEFERRSAELTLRDVRDIQKRIEEDAETPQAKRVLGKYPRAEGWLLRVDCMQDWTRIHILTEDGKNVSLGIFNKRDVVTADMKNLELSCGPQKSKVVVAYEPAEDAAREIQGKVRYFRLLIDR